MLIWLWPDCLFRGPTSKLHQPINPMWFIAFTPPSFDRTQRSVALTSQPGRVLIGHQMAALIGFCPKLCWLNHWHSTALDTDPAHLRCPANTHTHTLHTCRRGHRHIGKDTHTEHVSMTFNYKCSFIRISHLTANNNSFILSICLYLLYVLSIDFKAFLFEDYGPLKSKCPCLT